MFNDLLGARVFHLCLVSSSIDGGDFVSPSFLIFSTRLIFGSNPGTQTDVYTNMSVGG